MSCRINTVSWCIGMRLVVMTDLDGCILDPETYEYDKALPLIQRLREQGIEIIFSSSKTKAEQLLYIDRLGLKDIVFIVENGAAIYIPKKKAGLHIIKHNTRCRDHGDYYACVLGRTISEIKNMISDIIEKHRDHIIWMDEITPRLFSELTGLPEDEAVLALKREYSYLFIPKTKNRATIDEVLDEIRGRGLNIQVGGVGISQINGDHDKGKALLLLRDLIKDYRDAHIIAVGDAMNDAPMLKVADTGVLLGVDLDVVKAIGRDDLIVVKNKGSLAWRNILARLTGNYDLVIRG